MSLYECMIVCWCARVGECVLVYVNVRVCEYGSV